MRHDVDTKHDFIDSTRMSENASHVIIHHYIENSSSFNCAGVACCVILIAVVVVLLLIVVGVLIYIIVYLTRDRQSRRPVQPLTTREMQGYDNAIDDTSSCNAATAATSIERDVCDNDNAQSIPMTTFRTRSRTDAVRQDSSDSSAGLYDVLFPEQHEGEVMYDPPTKLMTFAGQVYTTGSRPGSDAGPSGSRQPCGSESLVWDYFHQSAGTPANSEVGLDADSGVIDNICWVKKKGKAKIKVSKIPQDLEVINFIKKYTQELVSSGLELRYLEDSQVTPEEWFQNNEQARSAAQDVMKQVDAYLGQNSVLVCKNFSPGPIIKKFGNDEYLLPPHSTFHLSDIASFFESNVKKFDLIVIDPPWINKSVKRKNSYNSMKYDVLKNLPVEKLTNTGCLIVVWITNSSSSASFVLEELFPKCNVTTSAIWHWCKITKKGNYVHPIDSHHKKPYESLILGRVCYDNDMTNLKPEKEIGSRKLLVSVPSSIHSHKPPLTEILKPFVKPNANCLELFARYLLPGWTSVGNEVLKLQNIKLFERVDS